MLGLDPRRDGVAVRTRVGYLPGDLHLQQHLTGQELLGHFARLHRMNGLGDGPGLARRLDVDLDRPIHELSKGNRQRLGLVQAIMHRPELLVVDEPTAGLDPLVQHMFYERVEEVTNDGRSREGACPV